MRSLLRLLAVLLIAAVSTGRSHAEGPLGKVSVNRPTQFGVSPPLSTLPPAARPDPFAPMRETRHPPVPLKAQMSETADKVLQTLWGAPDPGETGSKFAGIDGSGYNLRPSDANIAVGPNHIVQAVNTRIAIYNKAGALAAGYPKSLGAIWDGVPGCNNSNSDPVVRYDRVADRYIVTQVGSLAAPFSECIAVSTTANPNGTYTKYKYEFGASLNDYPKFSVWPSDTNSAYLATYNMFDSTGTSFRGARLCAYDRAKMLAGDSSAAQICVDVTPNTDCCYLPSDFDLGGPPSGGGYFWTWQTATSIRGYRLTPDFIANTATVDPAIDVTVAAFSLPTCGFFFVTTNCVPQPGTNRKLDNIGDRPMFRLAYGNFGGAERLTFNHTVVGSNGAAGIRWYELRKGSGGGWSLFQQGTFSPSDGVHRWNGSVAMDKVGNLALGYSASSGRVKPSIRLTSHQASDALGSMRAETVLVAGGYSQTGSSRWGDYSSMVIDPSDDCTFWYTNQYVTSSGMWTTAINSYKVTSGSSACQ